MRYAGALGDPYAGARLLGAMESGGARLTSGIRATCIVPFVLVPARRHEMKQCRAPALPYEIPRDMP